MRPVRGFGYARTKAQPVLDRAGNQALAQVFRRVRAHGNAPVADAVRPRRRHHRRHRPARRHRPIVTATGSSTRRTARPRTRRSGPAPRTCPTSRSSTPTATASTATRRTRSSPPPGGSDADPGTRDKPKRQIQAAVAAAAGKGRYVLAAAGSYSRVVAATGVGIYGGYDPANWSVRRASLITRIVGVPEGVFASNVTGVELQLLSVHGDNAPVERLRDPCDPSLTRPSPTRHGHRGQRRPRRTRPERSSGPRRRRRAPGSARENATR